MPAGLQRLHEREERSLGANPHERVGQIVA